MECKFTVEEFEGFKSVIESGKTRGITNEEKSNLLSISNHKGFDTLMRILDNQMYIALNYTFDDKIPYEIQQLAEAEVKAIRKFKGQLKRTIDKAYKDIQKAKKNI